MNAKGSSENLPLFWQPYKEHLGLLSGVFIALKVAQWSGHTQSSLCYLHTWMLFLLILIENSNSGWDQTSTMNLAQGLFTFVFSVWRTMLSLSCRHVVRQSVWKLGQPQRYTWKMHGLTLSLQFTTMFCNVLRNIYSTTLISSCQLL